ncbi:MAG TPA: YetF domain-containing protein [Actinomycetota bacterium]|jgi:uncharacterized membrane protein YcaP (DUF421 family)
MDLVLRMAVVYLFVLLLTRLLGRRELSSLQPFDVIFLVVIGDLIQQGVTQNDLSVTGIFLVLSTLVVLLVATSYLTFRFRRLRPVLEGRPIVLVQRGQLIEENLRRERLTQDDVVEQARLNQIESLDQVKWAVLESSGQISFIKQNG